MSGWLKIVGLGPGSEAMVTPEVTAALQEATDVVGYVPYVNRAACWISPPRLGQPRRDPPGGAGTTAGA